MDKRDKDSILPTFSSLLKKNRRSYINKLHHLAARVARAILGWGHGFWLESELSQHPHLPPFHHCLRVGRTVLQIQRHSWRSLAGRARLEISGWVRCAADCWWGLCHYCQFELNTETKGRSWDPTLINMNRETCRGWDMSEAKVPTNFPYSLFFRSHTHPPV